MKKKFLLIFILWASLYGYGQEVINTAKLIQAGLDDGAKLVNAYITPINKAIVYGLSDVSYTKIKKEQKRHLLLSVKLAYVSVPSEDLSFDVDKIGLQNLEPKDPTRHITPTVFGDSLQVITLVSKQKDLLGRPLIEFDTPGGGQKSALPLPFLSATYRLKYTNLTAHFIPYVQVPTSDLKVGMFGLAFQQDMAMFIKSLRDSDFGISLQAGASYLYGHADLNVQPNGVYSPVTPTGNQTGPYDNQALNTFFTSIQFGAYADYQIGEHFTIFAGGGYNVGSSNIQVTGRYPVYIADPVGIGSVVAEDVDDPLDLSGTFTRTKFDMGVRADFERLFIQLNYNISTYGGLGLNLGYKLF